MKEPKPIDLNTTVNYLTSQVKRKLDDRKTTIFIVITAINIFLWGLLLADYRELNRNYETLQDKHELTQVMITKLKADKS